MRARVAAIFVALAGLGALAYVVIETWGDPEMDFLLGLAGIAFALVGALVLARTGGNRVGWVLAATGLALLGSGVAGTWSDRGLLVGDAAGGALWLSFFFLVGLLMYWFPTGRPLTPRWRWVGWMGAVGEALSLTYLVSGQLCVEQGDGPCAAWADNPIGVAGVPNPEYGWTSGPTFLLLVGFALLSAVSLIVRYRRARGVERLQIKWFTFAVVNVILLMVVREVVEGALPISPVFWDVLFGVSVLALPVAIGASVMRYRLYEIDRIVSRTVSYALVVGLLALVFFTMVTAVTALVEVESDLAVAGSTLAVAALFNPVRRRVQSAVDRRFNRSRYDAEKVMDGFASSLRDEVDLDQVVDGWVGVVSETMRPSTVAVWVR